MRTQVTISGITFDIESKYKGNKQWSASNTPNYNNHLISVRTEFGKTSFEFWSSIAKHKIESDDDLIGAFDCFVRDALVGDMSYDDFISEFGYEDNREARRIYNACKKALDKIQIVTNDADIYELANEMQETFDI